MAELRVETETLWPAKAKIVIWSFTEKLLIPGVFSPIPPTSSFFGIFWKQITTSFSSLIFPTVILKDDDSLKN